MRIITITWVSWSWKTTLQNELLKLWWKTTCNFTTRKPRNKEDLNNYIFINKTKYDYKVRNWEFMEHMVYNWHWYWMSKDYDKDSNLVMILTPAWREIIREYFANLDISIESYFIDLPEEEQKTRMINRWDNEIDIERRKKDYKFFFPSVICRVLSWLRTAEELINLII